MTALTRLRLNNFRNYETLGLDLDGRHVCLYGPNGAGKTNLLEAISQLGPGRGLRSASLSDLTRQGADTGWTVSATLDERRIGVGLETDGATSKRVIRIDGAPSQAGDWEIKPGEEYVSRYRFVVTDGKPDAALLERLWRDYAHPPRVEVYAAE